MSLINEIINNNVEENKDQVDTTVESFRPTKTYKLDDIRVCQLATISNKKKKTLFSRDIISRIIKFDALMVRVNPNWYMDIKSGKCYEVGGMFTDELECPNNKYYVAGTEPITYTCYETIQSKGMDVNAEYSAIEIRQLYNIHFANNTKTF